MEPKDRFDRSELRAVGRRLRLRRVAKGWSLKHLSDTSGISVAAIRKVELGASNPSLLTILALVEALDEPVDRLIGEVLRRDQSIHIVRAADRAAAGGKSQLDAPGDWAMAGGRVQLNAGEDLPNGGQPAFGYVLDGAVEITRDAGDTETCRAGDAFHIFNPERDRVRGTTTGAHLIVMESAGAA